MFGPLRSSHLYIWSFCVFWVVWAIQIQLSPDPFWTICFCEVLSKCSHALLISWALLSFSGEKQNCLTFTCLKCGNIALYCINGSLWTYYWIAHTTSFILTRHRKTPQLIIGLVGLLVFYLDRSSMCTNNGAVTSKYKTACDSHISQLIIRSSLIICWFGGFGCLMCKPLWQKLCSLEPG